ncbi:MAG: putative membrane protein [Arenicella sp.]|jgi:uncharacterized membrane protein
MIQHLLEHPLGLVHSLTALLAIIFGAAVIFSSKGTKRHQLIGRAYVVAMWLLNITALMDYELYGYFGPFHWMALISLATVVIGHLAVLRKRPGWKQSHAYIMSWSYVGLIAAAVAETVSRVPGWSFGYSVIIGSVITILIGRWLIKALLPRILNTHLK